MKRKNISNDEEHEQPDSASDVKMFNNHIYFYADVNTKNILELNMMINEINQCDLKFDDIFIHIQSYGGDVYEALSAVDTILNSEIPVTTIVEGYAASAATLISISGDYRYIFKHASMLVHQLRGGTYGKKCDLDDEHANLQRLDKRLKNIYKEHTVMKMKQIEDISKKEIDLDAETCLKYGLADEIYKIEKKRRLK